MTKKLYHPHVAGWSIEVDDDQVDAYAETGWRKTDPSARTQTSAKSGEDSK